MATEARKCWRAGLGTLRLDPQRHLPCHPRPEQGLQEATSSGNVARAPRRRSTRKPLRLGLCVRIRGLGSGGFG